jgi:hypothetical protein
MPWQIMHTHMSAIYICGRSCICICLLLFYNLPAAAAANTQKLGMPSVQFNKTLGQNKSLGHVQDWLC